MEVGRAVPASYFKLILIGNAVGLVGSTGLASTFLSAALSSLPVCGRSNCPPVFSGIQDRLFTSFLLKPKPTI